MLERELLMAAETRDRVAPDQVAPFERVERAGAGLKAARPENLPERCRIEERVAFVPRQRIDPRSDDAPHARRQLVSFGPAFRKRNHELLEEQRVSLCGGRQLADPPGLR